MISKIIQCSYRNSNRHKAYLILKESKADTQNLILFNYNLSFQASTAQEIQWENILFQKLKLKVI